MFNKITILGLLLLLNLTSYCQQFTISGFVVDTESKESLIGVNIYDPINKKGTVSNNYGFFSVNYKKGDSVHLNFSYIGYSRQSKSFVIKGNKKFQIKMKTNNVLKTVDIFGTKKIEETTEISAVSIPIEQIKKLPSIMGETDIIRSYQLMPGIQSGKEGTSGLYVRGGSPDQNLFLLDDIALYNVSHIGGFLSVFDANAINSVKLYKGGFPARYGGRLSSVVDIRMKDGNKNKVKGEVAVGTISTKISIEGPIKKDTSSYILSLRRCNVDLITRVLSLIETDGEVMGGYTFYDIYGKYNRILKNSDRVFVSFYAGRDKIFIDVFDLADREEDASYKSNNDIKWGNVMGSIRYNKVLSPKLFGSFILAYSQYKYEIDAKSKQKNYGESKYKELGQLTFTSGVKDMIAKTEFDYFAFKKHKIKFGGTAISHFFSPGKSFYSKEISVSENDTTIGAKLIPAFEAKLFIEDEWQVSKKLSLLLGVHYAHYFINGSSFPSIQPRINLNYIFRKGFSVKASYVEMNQNTHLLSSSGAGLPSDLWVPANKALKPEKSNQFTLGFAHTMDNKSRVELSLEGYYKVMSNLIEYKDGASFFGINENIEDKVETGGKAEIYGIEFLAQKKVGKLSGWIGYTWSKNFRTFKNINKGNPFPYRYDTRHDISVASTYALSKKIDFSMTWEFRTGSALTLAQGKHTVFNNSTQYGLLNGPEAHIYNSRNSYRMSNYHKMDINVNLKKKKKHGIRTWSIGVYNVYARQNASFLYYKYDIKDKKLKLYQLSLFPIMPYVSYSYKFQ